MKFTIEVEGAPDVKLSLSRLNRAGVRRVKEVVRTSADRMARTAKRLAPEDSGAFRSDIGTRILRGGLSAEIGVFGETGPLAHLIEFGTKAHWIRNPRGEKRIRFDGDGGLVFTREIRHPGTAAQPFLGPAFEQERPRYTKDLRRAIRGAGREASRT